MVHFSYFEFRILLTRQKPGQPTSQGTQFSGCKHLLFFFYDMAKTFALSEAIIPFSLTKFYSFQHLIPCTSRCTRQDHHHLFFYLRIQMKEQARNRTEKSSKLLGCDGYLSENKENACSLEKYTYFIKNLKKKRT